KTPMEEFAVMLVTARAGVTSAAMRIPARPLSPTSPARAPSAEESFDFWAGIRYRVRDVPTPKPEWTPHETLGIPNNSVTYSQYVGDSEQLGRRGLGTCANRDGPRRRAGRVPQARKIG